MYMLRDAARIQVSDAEYLNRQHEDDPEWRAIQPLYDEDDAIETLTRFVAIPYDTPFAPLPGLQATLVEAGHILGSAQVHLDVPDGATTTRRLVFSGDLGRKDLPILRDPAPIDRADYLFMEIDLRRPRPRAHPKRWRISSRKSSTTPSRAKAR